MLSTSLRFGELFIHAKLIPCAHSCKYCLMGDKKLARLTSGRFIAFIHRFREWERDRDRILPVGFVLNYTSNYDRPTLELLRQLNDQFPQKYSSLQSITLGGLPWRSDEDLRAWLLERQEFGCRAVHASLAGTGAVHDYWNSRPGNFDLIMRTLQTAGDLGMALGARLFVTRSTLPYLEELNELLEGLPKNDGGWRYALPFFYAGWGTKLEDERIDEDIRDNLPAWLDPLIKRSTGEGTWRSEREWIAYFEARQDFEQTTNLILDVTDDNIERLESMSCDAIVAEYEARTRTAYDCLPSLATLSDRYGDKDGRRIYPLERCIIMKWLDMYLRDNPVSFERQLTHLQLGN